MKRNIISDRQATSMVIMFIVGTPMIYGVAKPAEENAWISLILALLISIPIQLMYARLLSNFPGKNLYDIFDIIFGNILGKCFSVLFLWHAFYLGALLFKWGGEFLVIVGLNDTPEMISISLIVVLSILTLKLGIKAFGKWCEFFVIIVFLVICITAIFLVPLMKLDNIIPVMYDGVKPVLKGTIYALTFPFTQSIIFLMIFDCLKTKKSSYKVYVKGVLLGAILLLVMTFLDIAILGKGNFSHVYFPTYMTLRRLSVGEFFQRVEMGIISVFILVGFVKIVSCLFAVAKGISHLLKFKDYGFIAAPVTFLTSILGYLAVSSTMEMGDFDEKVWVPYAILFQIILPFIIFIAGEIKIKRLKRKFEI